MREFFPAVYGNQEARAALASSLLQNTLPHALIFAGEGGSGKHLLAGAVAAALLCERAQDPGVPLPCGLCRSCQKAAAGLSPDITFLEPEEGKSRITVDQIRAIRSDMYLAANDGDRKIYIIGEADAMNAAAQNALLVSLEEPPDGVYIFLLSESPEALLPTVRSRCQLLRMQLFEPDALSACLSDLEPRAARLAKESPEKYRLLLEAAHGRIGEAKRLLSAPALGVAVRERELCDGVLSAIGGRSYAALFSAFSSFPADRRENLSELFRLLSDGVRDLILLKRDENVPLTYFYDREQALLLSEGVGLRRLLHFADALGNAIGDLDRNANTTLLLQDLCDTARKF